jgi:7,8-dihydroneopterin aldolase/epimerase/oxygenase
MADKLLLDDVRFFGRHGAIAAEQEVGTWFAVDAELTLDLAPAALSDDLRATVDYRAVARRIVEVGTGRPVKLVERLAGLIVDTLLREFPASEVRVRVRKLRPPLDGIAGTPAVELVRRR